MYRISLLLLCFLMTISCTRQIHPVVTETTNEAFRQSSDFHEKLLLFQQLVDRTLQWRTEALSFYSYIENKDIYSNRDILLLHEQGTERYMRLREELLAVLSSVEWAADDTVQIQFVEQHTSIETLEYEAKESTEEEPVVEKITVVQLNPRDSKGQLYIKQAKMGLASALLLYDNYLLAISHYQELKKTRQLLNYDNRRIREYLDTVTASFLNPENYLRTARALSLFERELQWEQKNNTSFDDDNEYLNLLIRSSYTYERISRGEDMELLPGTVELFTMRLADTLDNTSKVLSHLLVQSFSNVIGLVETRKGKLTALDALQRQTLADKLQPLDILLEKTPFRLTDKTIPGYWGHVGIWIGNQNDLEKLGIWDHPLVKPYQQRIRDEKRYIIEALLPGVQINTLEHFLNIDDLAVLRPVDISRQERKQAVLRAFSQLGKDYDYNFDVETDKRIVCSEIAYVVFNNYPWETERILGRATISPDNVANYAARTGKFKTVLLYLDGRQVATNLDEKMRRLLASLSPE